jgi:UDP-glucose 4-epimerase
MNIERPTIRRVRVAVTGGAGFIGSNLVDALVERGDDVLVLDDLSSGKRENVNPEAALVLADIRAGVDVEGRELVYHLAAQADVQTSVRRPDFDAEVNVVGTVQVLEGARRAGAQVVFASTGGAIYGECAEPAVEDGPLEPLSPYGIAKLCAEQYLFGWNRLHGSRHVVTRFANVYGARQDSGLEGGVVAIFLDRLRDGREVEVFADGNQTRDFVFVGDVVSALLAAAGAPAGVYNVGSGVPTSVVELYRLCAQMAGVGSEPHFAPDRPGDLRHSVLDSSLATSKLGWRAEIPLAEGVARTWNSLRG